MRLVGALLYILGGLWGLAQIMGEPPLWLFWVAFFVLTFTSVPLFNEGLLRSLKRQSVEDSLKELVEKGKATSEVYTVNAAMSFNDLNTGSMVHLLDIGDERILCLNGQYLYDYEPVDDDPESNQARRFPTRQFTLIRRVKGSEVLSLQPGAEVVEPQLLEHPPMEKLYDLGFELTDGEIRAHVSFDQLRALARSGSPRS